MPLLPKAKGGYRTIGVMLAIQRLWSRARRIEADEWEHRNFRAYFAAGSGSSPVDIVWRQAVRQEARAAEGSQALLVLDDLEAFYEVIDREVLLREAVPVDIPIEIAKAAIPACACPRVLPHQGMLSRPVYPKKGNIAGCSLATTLNQV